MLRSLAIPTDRGLIVLGNSLTLGIHLAEAEVRIVESLIGGLTEPFQSLGKSLFIAPPNVAAPQRAVGAPSAPRSGPQSP
jgi:hypothetical protein